MDNQLPYLPYIKINLVQNVDFIQCVESLHMRLLMQLGRHGYLQLHHSLQRPASSMQLVREQRHGEIVFSLDPRSAPAAGDLSSRKRKSSPDVIGPRHRMPYERHRARRRKLLSDDCPPPDPRRRASRRAKPVPVAVAERKAFLRRWTRGIAPWLYVQPSMETWSTMPEAPVAFQSNIALRPNINEEMSNDLERRSHIAASTTLTNHPQPTTDHIQLVAAHQVVISHSSPRHTVTLSEPNAVPTAPEAGVPAVSKTANVADSWNANSGGNVKAVENPRAAERVDGRGTSAGLANQRVGRGERPQSTASGKGAVRRSIMPELIAPRPSYLSHDIASLQEERKERALARRTRMESLSTHEPYQRADAMRRHAKMQSTRTRLQPRAQLEERRDDARMHLGRSVSGGRFAPRELETAEARPGRCQLHQRLRVPLLRQQPDERDRTVFHCPQRQQRPNGVSGHSARRGKRRRPDRHSRHPSCDAPLVTALSCTSRNPRSGDETLFTSCAMCRISPADVFKAAERRDQVGVQEMAVQRHSTQALNANFGCFQTSINTDRSSTSSPSAYTQSVKLGLELERLSLNTDQ
ncbi:hypothetical protein IEO21_08729 [Rhodonia placenta]|uniref:Uncharacterized protein n=1 Tax=Rhodonia placenta TaxID=104341 RepID=A0A8H7NVP7_9APHY|nr:hypothetical protein IEO21_08729 [Postia placenta]